MANVATKNAENIILSKKDCWKLMEVHQRISEILHTQKKRKTAPSPHTLYPSSQSTTALAVGECEGGYPERAERVEGYASADVAPQGRKDWYHGLVRGAP